MDKMKVGCDKSISYKGNKQLLTSLLTGLDIEWMDIDKSTIASLAKGVIDLLIMPLKWVPLERPEDIVVAGLGSRTDSREVLVINKENYSENKPLKIPENGKVGYFYNRQAAQLKTLRTDLICKPMELNGSNLDEYMLKHELSGLIVSQADLKWKNIEPGDHKLVPLHPMELIPQPGEGTLAFLTQVDHLLLRRHINKIHEREVALCTNVERRLLRRFDEKDQSNVSAFCQRDPAGNFHAAASVINSDGEVIFSSFSQSTHLELDLRLYHLLNQKA